MALYSELPIYRDTYKLIIEVFNIVKEFPREHKYYVGDDMRKSVFMLFKPIYRANSCKDKEEKIKYLDNFIDNFEELKIELKLCIDLHITTFKRAANALKLMESIGWKQSIMKK
jgi:four helix bundle protein